MLRRVHPRMQAWPPKRIFVPLEIGIVIRQTTLLPVSSMEHSIVLERLCQFSTFGLIWST